MYNNDLPVPYFRMHNARYRKKGWNIQYKQNKVCQIDINQKSLDNDKNIVLEMLHQMVHIYCWKQNKKDTSRGGQYHNKIFRDIANEKGLVVDYNKNSGYQVIDISTSLMEEILSEMSIEKILDNIKKCVDYEQLDYKSVQYYCPICKKKIYAAPGSNIICGYCMVNFIQMSCNK